MAKKKVEEVNRSRKSAPKQESNLILRYAPVWLVLAAVVVYFKTFFFTSLTQLDDTIFIFDKMEFNKHFLNIFKTFNMGCFNEKDIYYRPIFLITFILEHPLFSKSYTIYHFTNLLLHSVDVLLLFTFLKRINIPKHVAFVLALVYAVHPVLTMAVAWIPGRNDLLLALFTYSFFLSVIKYSEKPDPLNYILQLVFYLLCLFTKETAAFIPFVTVLLFYCWKKDNLFQPKYYALAAGWLGALLLWYFKRQMALESSSQGFPIYGVLQNFGYRVPGLLQYLGKIFLPFNLSVFPTIKETTYVYGIISFIGLTVIVFLNRERDNRMVLLGAGWFTFFILPFFFVPKNINDQLFEHRLYLPIVGIFILVSQSILFTKKIHVIGKTIFKNPFSFEGRIERAEYVFSWGLRVATSLALFQITRLLHSFATDVLLGILIIALIWFKIAQAAKRCHDMNVSGWFQLIPFCFFWLSFADGKHGSNQYGADPKERIESGNGNTAKEKMPINVTNTLTIGISLSCVLAAITFIYMNQFDNELVFWSNAATHSPTSAYANKMYGIKLAEASKPDEAKPYFVKAYSLDSTERYTNLFLARLIYIPADSISKAERALKNEVRLNSTFPDTYFELAHVYFMKNDLQDAKINLIKFLSYRPDDKISNNNLMKLYIDLKEFKEAKEQIDKMEQMGITVDAGTKASVDNELNK